MPTPVEALNESLKERICPHCKADLKGPEIPKEDRQYYSEGATHFSEWIAIQYSYDCPEHYDGVSEYMCPYCETRFGRWTGNILEEGELEPRFGGR